MVGDLMAEGELELAQGDVQGHGRLPRSNVERDQGGGLLMRQGCRGGEEEERSKTREIGKAHGFT